MRKECELCRQEAARMYCESDQASLCWECDAKVHAANFLVARHTRTLLCHHCHSPTPWSASGPNLGPTLSVCHLCVAARPRKLGLAADPPSLGLAGRRREDPRVEDAGSDGDREDVMQEDDFDEEEEEEEEEEDVGEEEEEEEEEDVGEDDEDVDSEDEEEEEEGDNQVVPWSASPPPAASSSTSEESFPPYSSDTSNNNNVNVRSPPSSKRMRDEDDGGWHIEVESSRPLQPAGTCVGDVETTSSIVSHRHKRSLFLHRPSLSMAVQSEKEEGRDRSHGRNDLDHLVSVTAAGGSGDRRL